MPDLAATGSARPLRADARRNRERILESAREVFSADGAEAQMDDIALRAGVGVGTLYRHFPTKEALLLELVREKLRVFDDNVVDALASDDEAGAVFEALLRRNAEIASSDAVMQQMLAGTGDRLWSRLQVERDRLDAHTSELIERARLAGAVRADLKASDVAMMMCGLCATMAHGGAGFDWRRYLDLSLEGLTSQ